MAGFPFLGVRPLDLISVAVATACLTLAALHLVIWSKDRTVLANLWFSVLATGMATFTWFALAMMRAETPQEFVTALRWLNVPIFAMVGAVAMFVNSYFRTARPWYGYAACGIRLLTLLVNFVRPQGMDYARIDAVYSVRFLGDTVSVAQGTTSAWHWVGQLTFVVLLWHIVDGSRSLRSVGTAEEKRRVRVVGVPLAVFVFAAPVYAALIFGSVVRLPHIEFVPFLGLLCAMSYELCRDVLRSAQLSRELQTSEAALRDSEGRMTMAADAARLGMWMWDIGTGQIWLTEKCRELFAIAPDESVNYERFSQRVHPEDRAGRDDAIRYATATGTGYQTEYRVVLPDGGLRWISSHGRIESDAAGTAVRALGVCMDISNERAAELAARELGGRLIDAQEDERRRIARDLHDDVNQRLALLSVELELLGQRSHDAAVGPDAGALAAQVRELSSDVHKLSYQLHPAKLDQLGLVTAARSWCRDLAQQSGVRVEFSADGIPDELPPDIGLCLFRIVQEALRNVVRHSGAATAQVEVKGDPAGVHLVVRDTGRGFDPAQTSSRVGLGLLSMNERVRSLHGSIAVKSVIGVGTTIVAALPWPKPSTASIIPADRVSPGSLS